MVGLTWGEGFVLNFDKVTFTLTAGADTLTAAVGDDVDDLILAPTMATLAAGDTIDAGTGTDQIALVGGGTLFDNQLAGTSSVEALWLASPAKGYALLLGEEAEAAGIIYVNAFDVGAGVAVGAAGMTQGLLFDTGAGNNTFVGGIGADTVFVTSTLLTAGDKITGGGFGADGGQFQGFVTGSNDVLAVYDRAALTDAAFANVNGIEQITIRQGGTPLDYIGQKITLGKLSDAAGIVSVVGDNDYALTVDAGARSKGLSVTGSTGDDVFVGTGGDDLYQSGLGNDSYRVKLSAWDSADRYDGGQGSDEIRILADGKAADAVVDDDFQQFTSVERLVFDAVGKQDVTLAGFADLSGLALVDAGKVSAGLTLDATDMANGLSVIAGTGADKIEFGDSGDRAIYIKSSALTAADTIDGGSQDTDETSLHFIDAVKLTDANFAGLNTKITQVSILDLDSDAAGQSLIAGTNFAAFVATAGLIEIDATSENTFAGSKVPGVMTSSSAAALPSISSARRARTPLPSPRQRSAA